jgi:multidrug efflux pump
VMGGMITATSLAVFFVPVFFVVIRTLFKSKNPPRDTTPSGAIETAPHPAPTGDHA